MEQLFFGKREMQSNLFHIMAAAASLANLLGSILNIVLYGMAFSTRVCIGCGIIIVAVVLLGSFTKSKTWAIIGILVTVIWIELPLLYSVYKQVILIYFILGIVGIVMFTSRKYSTFLSAAVVWHIMVMIVVYFYQDNANTTEDGSMLIFEMCSYVIVAVSVLVILNAIIKLQEQQREDLRVVNEQLYFTATHDSLTQLYNREYLMKEIELRMKRDNSNFIAVILDIDDFKKLNDTYGHTFGDYVLVQFAHIMQKETEGKGFAARYGGEEFMIIFDNMNQSEAVQILENISNKLEECFLKEKQITVSFSGGLETYSVGNKIDELIKRADSKLYEAKRRGKKQVIC